MKFEKVTPKEPWTKEKTEERMKEVMEAISQINRDIEINRKKINGLNSEIWKLSVRLSNRAKYYNQLKNQLKE